MTFVELVQARMPAAFLGASIHRVRVATHREGLEALIVGLEEPLFVSYVELTVNGLWYADVLEAHRNKAAP